MKKIIIYFLAINMIYFIGCQPNTAQPSELTKVFKKDIKITDFAFPGGYIGDFHLTLNDYGKIDDEHQFYAESSYIWVAHPENGAFIIGFKGYLKPSLFSREKEKYSIFDFEDIEIIIRNWKESITCGFSQSD